MGPEILGIEVEAETPLSTGVTPEGERRLIPFADLNRQLYFGVGVRKARAVEITVYAIP